VGGGRYLWRCVKRKRYNILPPNLMQIRSVQLCHLTELPDLPQVAYAANLFSLLHVPMQHTAGLDYFLLFFGFHLTRLHIYVLTSNVAF
jgi:hypothetical protein